MFGHSFYNSTTRKYVAIFGTLFNDISISRTDHDGNASSMKIPLNYGPMQKFLARTQQDPDFTAPAMTLPRMAFELIDIGYDPDRMLSRSAAPKAKALDPSEVNATLNPIPYNFQFNLYVMAKYSEDALKITEQIFPFFTPAFTVSAKMLDGYDLTQDVPIVLNGVSMEDTYEGSFEDRRAIIWTLTFTLKGYFYGPTSKKKLIQFVNNSIYSTLDATSATVNITVQPGLTANGEPTTSIAQSIPYNQIASDDNWAYIVKVSENE